MKIFLKNQNLNNNLMNYNDSFKHKKIVMKIIFKNQNLINNLMNYNDKFKHLKNNNEIH